MATVVLQNNTQEVVRLALFRTPELNPTLGSIAWQVAEPPPGGTQVIQIPSSYSVYGQYSTDAANLSNLNAETAHLSFVETTALFSIEALNAPDQRSHSVVIRQLFDGLVLNQVRIANHYRSGVVGTIACGGDPIFMPQVIWPGGSFTEDLRGAMNVAVVAPFTYKGQRLVSEEVSQTQLVVEDGATVTVTGSMWHGYRLTVR